MKGLRKWLVWFGGWEKADGTGWKFRINYGHRIGWRNPYPLSVLGHMATFFSWGWQIRLSDNYWLVWAKRTGLYVSSDGTPPDSGNYEKSGFFILRFHR